MKNVSTLLSARFLPVSTSGSAAVGRSLIATLVLVSTIFTCPEVAADSHTWRLTFPTATSMGFLYELPEGQRRYRYLGKAQGAVSVPKTKIQLKLSQYGADHMQLLAHLQTNSIYSLDLSKARVDDAWLPNLRLVKGLKEVNLSGSEVTDKGVTYLGRLPLKKLELRRTRIEGHTLSALRQLKFLFIGENRFNDPDVITQVSKLTNLQNLGLAYAVFGWVKHAPRAVGISPQQDLLLEPLMNRLAQLKNLDTLALDGLPLSVRSFAFLQHLHRLDNFKASSTDIDSRTLNLLNAPIIKNLSLGYCTQLDDSCAPFLKRCNKLNYLDLSGTRVTGKTVLQIASTRMTHLMLSGVDLSLTQQSMFASMPSLHYLHVRDTKLTNEGIKSLRKHKLFTLEASDNNLTDQCIQYLLPMKSLTCLEISGNRISKAGFQRLKAALPRCKIIWG